MGESVDRAIRETVVKTLFALSGNTCAFQDIDTGRGCEERLTDPRWKHVKARIAHIRGLRPGSARWDATYPDPNAFENLLLLCPNDHTRVDELEPDRYTVAVLEEMKSLHEQRAEPLRRWSDEAELARFVQSLIALTRLEWAVDAVLDHERLLDESRQFIAHAINTMQEREKIVLTLYYYEGLTLSEIGEVLGVSASTVSRSHKKGALELRSLLGPDGLERVTDILQDHKSGP